MFRAISTSVVQRYEISERNANALTVVNTVFILHFSAFFTDKNTPCSLININFAITGMRAASCVPNTEYYSYIRL